ncbi:MAG: hypothetical protein HYR64_02960 [Fimbriimonas ginsengisoli]|uniref:Uncharacterized protein n=1 Tax=Fimbriimonas ginsengisoli TaxID=1005039 RepID=A0A931LTW2_FIMGI|nr:hypothetical protein [Fimbriimonas ginsengisoli]
MKLRTLAWVALGLVLASAVPLAITHRARREASKDEVALQEQLRLARAEGLPTNAAEYAAMIPTAAPSENAASLYRRLSWHETFSDMVQSKGAHRSVGFKLSPKALMRKYSNDLETIDKAVSLPRCRFDRDWTRGPAELMPEYHEMDSAAKLIAIRGTFAAVRGDVRAALADAQRIFRIARHAREEPNYIAHLVSESIYTLGLKRLAIWGLWRRDIPAYREAVKKALDAFPRPDLRAEHREDLYHALWLADHSLTTEGRRDIGIKEEDIPVAAKAMAHLFDQTKSRIKIVQWQRAYWAALDRPAKERGPLLAQARQQVMIALLAFPPAAEAYSWSDYDDWTAKREPAWEANRQMCVALLRSLDGPVTPSSIKTDDLLSPFNGKRLEYRFDGKVITITVSGGGYPFRVQVRPLGIVLQ